MGIKNWYEYAGVSNNPGVRLRQIQGKQQLIRVIERFEKPRVREIGIFLSYVPKCIPLLCNVELGNNTLTVNCQYSKGTACLLTSQSPQRTALPGSKTGSWLLGILKQGKHSVVNNLFKRTWLKTQNMLKRFRFSSSFVFFVSKPFHQFLSKK